MEPAVTVSLVGEAATLKSEDAAVTPVRVAICDPLAASSLMVRFPVRVPAAVGVNVTLMVQVKVTANWAGQLFVCAKSPLV